MAGPSSASAPPAAFSYATAGNVDNSKAELLSGIKVPTPTAQLVFSLEGKKVVSTCTQPPRFSTFLLMRLNLLPNDATEYLQEAFANQKVSKKPKYGVARQAAGKKW